jgi:hypothetical protein
MNDQLDSNSVVLGVRPLFFDVDPAFAGTQDQNLGLFQDLSAVRTEFHPQQQGMSNDQVWNFVSSRVAGPAVCFEDRNGERIKEQSWLAEHHLAYAGQWVALSGHRLLAAADTAIEVYRLARSKGVAVPFVAYVDAGDELPFAGW